MDELARGGGTDTGYVAWDGCVTACGGPHPALRAPLSHKGRRDLVRELDC